MKLLSFLGTGGLQETTYVFRDRQKKTRFIQEALAEFFAVESVILFSTEEAYAKNFREVDMRLAGCKPVTIPAGKNEQELWDIFSIVAGEVDPGDTIVFDITHGFRSLPFIAFLSSAYIRDIRKARIEAVVYGAYEARMNEETPVFDLTSFTRILDWMGAVRSFMVHGDAGDIQKIVKEQADRAYRAAEEGNRPVKMKDFSTQIESFCLATRMAQPIEALAAAERIIGRIPGAKEEIGRFAPPFTCILDQIEAISRFSAPEPGQKKGIDRSHLRAQRELISYQIEKGLYMQAVALAREWMVSLLIFAAGDAPSWLDDTCRAAAERAMTGGNMKKRGELYKPSAYSEWFESREYWEKVVQAWDMITQVRNDIAHCGMKHRRQKAKDYREKIGKIPGLLCGLEEIVCS